MKYRLFVPLMALGCVAAAAQTAPKSYTPAKTAWGDPDLQGQWPAFANIPIAEACQFRDAGLPDRRRVYGAGQAGAEPERSRQ